jgi:hypothetical protein
VPFVTTPPRVLAVIGNRPAAEHEEALHQVVSQDYFAAMRIPLLKGRTFTRGDAPGAVLAAVVSREFERRFFPNGAVDGRFRIVFGPEYELATHYQIVGVVENVRRQELTDDHRAAFYSFDRQGAAVLSQFVVRGSTDIASMMPLVRQAIREVTPQLVVTAITPMEERVARSVAEERFRAMLSSLFGAAALVLAAIGLYGLIARRAADRRREFGVRMSLGARPADVRSLVVRDAVLLTVAGLTMGLPAAYAAAQVTRTLLYGVDATSPRVFALTSAVLALAALTASLLPARRASRADPIAALRS